MRYDNHSDMKRLYRSEENKIFGGIMGGLGEYFEIDPVLIRIIAVFVTVMTGIVPMALVYLLMIFVVPKNEMGSRVIDVE